MQYLKFHINLISKLIPYYYFLDTDNTKKNVTIYTVKLCFVNDRDAVKANHTGKPGENCHIYVLIYFNTSIFIDVMELNNKLCKVVHLLTFSLVPII